MELSNTERLTFKKALLLAGRKPAGLSDTELSQEYHALMGAPMEAQAAEVIEPEVIDQPEPEEEPQQEPTSKLEEILYWLDIASATNCDWPFLVGPAGSGKTTLATMAAKALNIGFESVETLTDKFELLGFVDANGIYQSTAFYRAWKDGAVFLMDEVDRSAPDAVIAFNMALANGWFTFPNGERVTRHENCYIIAGGNTDGTGPTAQYNTAQVLDGSTRDRFHFIAVDYDPKIERQIAHEAAAKFNPDYNQLAVDQWVRSLQAARQFAKVQGLEVIVSPRKAISGGAMVGKGSTLATVKGSILPTLFTENQLKQMSV